MDWHKYFIYCDGEIYWKERPRDEFMSDKSHAATNSNFSGKLAGSIVSSEHSVTSYRQLVLNGSTHKCHRVIWEMHKGSIPAGLIVDHIDGNGLNNRIENLRLVNASDSARNCPLPKHSSTGVIGVGWHSAAKRWQARIYDQGKRIDLGRYEKIEDAIRVRKMAEIELGYHPNHGRKQNAK